MNELRDESAERCWLVFDVGCIECGENSSVVGVYETEEAAKAAAQAHVDRDSAWGRPEWHGQHSVEVFELPEVSR